MVKTARHFYDFGSFRVDAQKRRLLRDGEIVPLTPKAFDTLLVLVENSGRVVEKDDLMEKVWPGVAVEENNLTQNVSALRKALGERRDEPQYILTVSGLGYRFIASVEESWTDDVDLKLSAPVVVAEHRADHENGFAQTPFEQRQSVAPAVTRVATRRSQRRKVLVASTLVALIVLAGGYLFVRRARRTEAASATNTQVRSIAILPFKSLGSEGPDEYLGLGMADALITKLSSIRQINLRPTSSILKYTSADEDASAAGRELGVDAVLDGRVQKFGDHVRVTVQLVRSSDGSSLWAGKFDEKETDIFSVEDRISEEVVQALLPTLTDTQKQQLTKHYTEDTEAYQSYIKGRYYWNKRTSEAIKKAISYYEDAIIRDPNYALAYAGLADSYATLGIFDDLPPQETMLKARSAAMKALELDEGLAEAHASLGYVKHRYEWDWAGAEREYKRAIELNPQYPTAHQWYGWYLVSLGRNDDALAEFQRAQQLDPLSLYTNLTLGAPYYYSQQYDQAAEQYKRVSEMNPDFWLAHWWLFQTYTYQKRYDSALVELQKVAKLRGRSVSQFPLAAYLSAVSGRQAEARQMLEESQRETKDQYVSAYSLAVTHAGLGETNKAFAWLDKGLKEHDSAMVFVNVDHRLDSLRSDPRFAQLIKNLGLTP
jgi:DNA-binding winged helix-turn-helix (wHTH) protein/TolB-like protein/lipoprotein NlpI